MRITKIRNKEKIRKVKALRKQGLTLREIAKVVNMSYEWVRKQLDEKTKENN